MAKLAYGVDLPKKEQERLLFRKRPPHVKHGFCLHQPQHLFYGVFKRAGIGYRPVAERLIRSGRPVCHGARFLKQGVSLQLIEINGSPDADGSTR